MWKPFTAVITISLTGQHNRKSNSAEFYRARKTRCQRRIKLFNYHSIPTDALVIAFGLGRSGNACQRQDIKLSNRPRQMNLMSQNAFISPWVNSYLVKYCGGSGRQQSKYETNGYATTASFIILDTIKVIDRAGGRRQKSDCASAALDIDYQDKKAYVFEWRWRLRSLDETEEQASRIIYVAALAFVHRRWWLRQVSESSCYGAASFKRACPHSVLMQQATYRASLYAKTDEAADDYRWKLKDIDISDYNPWDIFLRRW